LLGAKNNLAPEGMQALPKNGYDQYTIDGKIFYYIVKNGKFLRRTVFYPYGDRGIYNFFNKATAKR